MLNSLALSLVKPKYLERSNIWGSGSNMQFRILRKHHYQTTKGEQGSSLIIVEANRILNRIVCA